MTLSSDNPIRMISIASGNMDEIQTHRRNSSWSNGSSTYFNSVGEEKRPRQERPDSPNQQHQQQPEREAARNGLGAEEACATESAIEAEYDKYKLPESVYSLLMTENMSSFPFMTGIIAGAISLTCLGLAFQNEIDNKSPGNPFGLPPGVRTEVLIAQYCGLIIGVVMENEIPQALELIGKGAEQKISAGGTHDEHRFSKKRIFLPALLRLSVGYMFLMCLFMTVVQESVVLDIFFDVLALEFVENIDDIIFGLGKRGFFGHSLRVATNNDHFIHTSKERHGLQIWTKRIIRCVYIFNGLFFIGLLSYVSVMQRNGAFRCNSIMVSFGDAIWEDAHVTIGGVNATRLLIYSHFNGIYEESGSFQGKPRYIERNKADGSTFKKTTGAQIVYCEEIESWILQHEHIKTFFHESEKENSCSWLLRTQVTESYDITELTGAQWFVWTGLIEKNYQVSIECNECNEAKDCNYNGKCTAGERCICDSDHFGVLCQYQVPCKVMRPEKNATFELKIVEEDNDVGFREVYGRPVYTADDMTGRPYSLMRLGHPDDDAKYFNVTYPHSSADGVDATSPHKHFHPEFFEDDDFFEVNNKSDVFQELLENYTFILCYTGRRWYGKLIHIDTTVDEEYHAFWDNAFSGLGQQDNSTLIISAPTSEGSPVGADFYEMRRRNVAFETGEEIYDYSPYGVLLPLIDYEGSGFFHCKMDNKNITKD